MSDIDDDTHTKMRRTIGEEFCRAESDFDDTRDVRSLLIGKLKTAALGVDIVDKDTHKVNEDTETSLKVVQLALRALEDVEKASTKIISLKQKQQEATALSAAATRERLEIVIRATAAGRIDDASTEINIDEHLGDMFNGEIKDFELKTSSADLSD